MDKLMVIQGRTLTADDLQLIRRLINDNPSWHRKRLSIELCQCWNWRAANGQLKDMSCRNLLLKLERRGHVKLPPPLRAASNFRRHHNLQRVPHQQSPIIAELQTLRPIQVTAVEQGEQHQLFQTFLARYHYRGYSGTVGENLKYLAFDRNNNPLACLLFGAPAWNIAARDTFIGWDAIHRKRHLHLLTNNMRFLILPWIRVPHLASHVLGRVARRIGADWLKKYGHPIYVLETFVERERFSGTCYQAANWHYVGQTRGRTRNDRDNSIHVPIKDVYLYLLTSDFREVLQS